MSVFGFGDGFADGCKLGARICFLLLLSVVVTAALAGVCIILWDVWLRMPEVVFGFGTVAVIVLLFGLIGGIGGAIRTRRAVRRNEARCEQQREDNAAHYLSRLRAEEEYHDSWAAADDMSPTISREAVEWHRSQGRMHVPLTGFGPPAPDGDAQDRVRS